MTDTIKAALEVAEAHLHYVTFEAGTPADLHRATTIRDGLRAAVAERDKALARVKELEAALKPFAEFAANNIEAEQWGGDRCERERINVWFGPSDFHSARAALKGADHE